MARISVVEYHRMTHTTGPASVLVSIRFGVTPDSGPLVTYRSSSDTNSDNKLNTTEYVEEVLSGINKANEEYGTSHEVIEIEIIPSDYPSLGQVAFCAYKLTQHLINKNKENKSQ